jgi:uncharacterized membrane protein
MAQANHRDSTRSAVEQVGAPAWLVDAVARIEDSAALDRASDLLDRAAAGLRRRPDARALLRGDAIGHALHPLLTDFPLGMWMSANYLDLLGGRRGRPAATRLIALGTAAALPTAASGLAEWLETWGRARRVGVAHAAINSAALALYGASLAARLSGRHRAGVALALAGGVAATTGGYLGGHLSLVHKIGTADPRMRARASGAEDAPPRPARPSAGPGG